MSTTNFIRIIVIFIFFTACNNSSKKEERQYKSSADSTLIQNVRVKLVVKNDLIEVVKCNKDSSISYSLYTPANYDLGKEYPLMIFCDPHGRGLLPIKKYKVLADKFGFVFVGSYDSKNGNSQERGMQLVEFIINDIKAKANIDSKRLYLCGFSGGARVAAAEALIRGGIAGVIGCGAGFPVLDKFPTTSFRYISIVGNEDFNYSELYSLDNDLEKTKIDHQLLVFNGKHDWCPVEIMDEALLLQQLYAMQDGLLQKEDTLIANNFTIAKKKIEKQKTADSYKTYLETEKTLKAFSGLTNVDELIQLFSGLENSPKVKLGIKETGDYFKAEESLRKGFLNAMAAKDNSWWKQQVSKMYSDIKIRPANEANLLKRILNYLSLAAYMNISQLLQQKQLEEAQQYWNIYQLVDPENPDVYYLSALMNIQLNKQDEIVKQLQKAADLGYADINNLEIDFKCIRETPEYKKAKSRVEENSKKE